MTEKYRVFSGDNFHSYDNDDGVDDGGSYETQEEAVAAAKLIVDKSLRWERKLNKKSCRSRGAVRPVHGFRR